VDVGGGQNARIDPFTVPTTGIYYLWFQFMVSFGMRIPQMPNYVWFLMPLIVVMVLRITAAILQRRRARVAVSAN